MRYKNIYKVLIVDFEDGPQIENIVDQTQNEGWIIKFIRENEKRFRYEVIAFKSVSMFEKIKEKANSQKLEER